jgi:hypothetical protein
MFRRSARVGKVAALGLLSAALVSKGTLADHGRIPVQPLQAYNNLDRSSITVSGLSSGAFFAHQFHVAYSSLVKGAGIVAGGPYACAEQIEGISPPFGNPFIPVIVPRQVVAASAVCTHLERRDFEQVGWRLPNKLDVRESWKIALSAHRDGMIDDPAHLATSRIWLFHGDQDTAIPRSAVEQVRTFYEMIGVPAANIQVRPGPDARHGMPIKVLPGSGTGQHCRLPDPSFLVQCDYGAAELLLRHLYPDSAAAPSGSASGRLVGFNQTEFFEERDRSTSLNETGNLYVPAACENASAAATRCRLHVAFHGCEQYVDRIHDLFVRDAGYNAWADANNVIVLYPQATRWLKLGDVTQLTANPKGCWDWWGYSGEAYLGRDGKQMRAVKSMIDRMLPN